MVQGLVGQHKVQQAKMIKQLGFVTDVRCLGLCAAVSSVWQALEISTGEVTRLGGVLFDQASHARFNLCVLSLLSIAILLNSRSLDS